MILTAKSESHTKTMAYRTNLHKFEVSSAHQRGHDKSSKYIVT